MTRWLSGEALFGAFMIAVFLAGAYDLLSVGGLSAVFDDSGIVFALIIILLSVALLAVVTLTPRLHAEERGPFMAKRGVVIALVGMSYPVLFWAFEYLIATALVGFVALGLFTEKFGRKQATIAFVFTLGSYLLFFFLLGITEPDGAIFSTGLNDVVPIWRRDFFQSF